MGGGEGSGEGRVREYGGKREEEVRGEEEEMEGKVCKGRGGKGGREGDGRT